MRDVNYGWLIRYIHANGASFFYIVVYIHMFRGLYYGSYITPREYLWCSGVLIFIAMMATIGDSCIDLSPRCCSRGQLDAAGTSLLPTRATSTRYSTCARHDFAGQNSVHGVARQLCGLEPMQQRRQILTTRSPVHRTNDRASTTTGITATKLKLNTSSRHSQRTQTGIPSSNGRTFHRIRDLLVSASCGSQDVLAIIQNRT
ncbi:hypothetical protein DYB32_009889 [Aphanomyces invadans]|uniref:Cytochrome b/b6 N-terminal region profile domain-containing protein n=1 Tax=Aphanomyces invadans TaxID=157072 RepID=A0A418AJM5_9STRA|nr:hypothetical protein DYB32_009889 [Aphanomyces invadans]